MPMCPLCWKFVEGFFVWALTVVAESIEVVFQRSNVVSILT